MIYDITKFCSNDISREVLGYVYVKEMAGGFIYTATDSYCLFEVKYWGDYKIKEGFYTKAIWKEVVKLFNKKKLDELDNYNPINRDDLQFPEYEKLFASEGNNFDFNSNNIDLDKLYDFVAMLNKIKGKPNFLKPEDYKSYGLFMGYEDGTVRCLLAPLTK